MSALIKVENISKAYTISHEGNERYTALRDIMTRKTKDFFSFTSLTGQINRSSTTEEYWALKDISFEIQKGDRVGVIGRNGAGKSTLLKILSRITEPTKGKISIKGRVTSLLEVGTGFHPELTGRENIYLNGAILGMARTEIRRKFDEIVDFAEVEKFLDTPVKRYSSGMYVRLAFAVAAHLDSEILIVDEVLAVGDAEFQRKCLGKMEDVTKGEGRTVLFVSHNMGSIQRLCDKGIFLDKGSLILNGKIDEVIHAYHTLFSTKQTFRPIYTDNIHLMGIGLKLNDVDATTFQMKDEITIYIDYFIQKRLNSIQCVLHVWTLTGVHVLSSSELDLDLGNSNSSKDPGKYSYYVKIPTNLLAPNQYKITFAAGVPNLDLFIEADGPVFEVVDIDSIASKWSQGRRNVIIGCSLNWVRI